MHTPIAFTGLTLATPLLDETARFYVNSFGLAEMARGPDEVALGAVATSHPPLRLRRSPTAGLVGLSFALRNVEALAAMHLTLEQAGHVPSSVAEDRFTIADPDGTLVTLHVGEDVSVGPLPEPTDRPLFLSHAVLNSRNPERLVAFYHDTLGLGVSDRYEQGLLVFLRSAQPQHHCIGISPADVDGLNHFAMDCGNIDAVMRAISRMHRSGHAEIWGPGRHGPGGNVFCYFDDPTGFVPEFTCDVLQIEDDANWQAQDWRRVPENGNTWLSGGPTQRAVALMSGAAFPNPEVRNTDIATE